MYTILFVVPDLQCHGYAKQAALLASALPRDQFAVHVGVLSEDGVFSEGLKQAGLPVHFLGSHRSWLHAFFALRCLLRTLTPDLVQSWSSAVCWAACAQRAMLKRRLLPLIAAEPPLHGFWLRQAARAVVHTQYDAGKTRHPQVRIIPPAVEENPAPLQRQAFLRECGLPEDARFILCAGAIEQDHGFREAVWIFDILKYVYPNLWLLLAGNGPQRQAVETFSRTLCSQDNRVKFLGVRNDIPQLVELADLAWICGRQGGRNFALEALAAGCPVVAPRLPKFVEFLGNREAGLLVASAAASDFAQASRRILSDPVLRSTLGEAGRTRAACFGLSCIVKQWLALYAEMISPAGCNSSPLLSP